jgi:hypothetical protein
MPAVKTSSQALMSAGVERSKIGIFRPGQDEWKGKANGI